MKTFSYDDVVKVSPPHGRAFIGKVYSQYRTLPSLRNKKGKIIRRASELIVCVTTPDGVGAGFKSRYVEHAEGRTRWLK